MSCTTAVHDFVRAAMSSWPTLGCLLMLTRLETNYQLHLLSWQFLFRSASADNPYLDFNYSGYHKHLIQLWYNIDQVESFSPTLAGGSYRPSITGMGSMISSLRLQFHVQAVLCPPWMQYVKQRSTKLFQSPAVNQWIEERAQESKCVGPCWQYVQHMRLHQTI